VLEKKKLTLYELIHLILSVFGLISLIIIYAQTRAIATQTEHSAASLRSTAYKAITDQEMEIDKLFIEHPKLRPYFYSGQKINEDNPDFAQAEAIAEYELDFFDSAQHQLEYIAVTKDIDMAEWNAYFDDSFRNSPILCARLNKIRTWYRSGFAQREQEVCSQSSKNRN
jgi:hypothetical protein